MGLIWFWLVAVMIVAVLSIVVLVLTIVRLPASIAARPDALVKYRAYPVLFVAPVVMLLAIIGVIYFSRKQDDRKAFACSCFYLAFMLVGAAVALYPLLLPSSDDPSRDITIEKALSGPHTLHVGLIWWAFGMCLALTYFVVVYRIFGAKCRSKAADTDIRRIIGRVGSKSLC